jgi:hypothetical protein
MIKFLTLRLFVCPLSLFLKEIPFASLTNTIDVKIERVLTGFWKVYTDGKWSSQHLYDFGFSRRFVLVRVWYLSSSEAYTNNWGLFGKENYLTFDWWKQMSYLTPIYMSFKSVFERNPICILDKHHRRENWESSNRLFDWLNNLFQPIKKPVRTNAGMTTSHLCTDFPMHKRVILTS